MKLQPMVEFYFDTKPSPCKIIFDIRLLFRVASCNSSVLWWPCWFHVHKFFIVYIMEQKTQVACPPQFFFISQSIFTKFLIFVV